MFDWSKNDMGIKAYRGPFDATIETQIHDIEVNDTVKHPANYIPHLDLVNAVNVARALGKPLLVTGEPGIGKTRLAYSIAWQLDLLGPFKFVAKSTSIARDLFYIYDSLGRFHAAEMARSPANKSSATLPGLRNASNPLEFIEFSALGAALLLALKHDQLIEFFGQFSADDILTSICLAQSDYSYGPKNLGRQSVVLIDEIDKAPKDFASDLLDELDTMCFRIPEYSTRWTPTPDRRLRPMVLITSNRERTLPPAFLRRCIYFDIPFPESRSINSAAPPGYYLEDIIDKLIPVSSGLRSDSKLVREAISFFLFVRDHRDPLRKPPSTAELIDWLIAMRASRIDPLQSITVQLKLIDSTLSALLKDTNDYSRKSDLLTEWSPDA